VTDFVRKLLRYTVTMIVALFIGLVLINIFAPPALANTIMWIYIAFTTSVNLSLNVVALWAAILAYEKAEKITELVTVLATIKPIVKRKRWYQFWKRN